LVDELLESAIQCLCDFRWLFVFHESTSWQRLLGVLLAIAGLFQLHK
jgi:hypothetical protein